MTKEEIIQNVLEEVNYDATKISRKFVCEDAQLVSLEEINAQFGSFGDFKIAALKARSSGSVIRTPTFRYSL